MNPRSLGDNMNRVMLRAAWLLAVFCIAAPAAFAQKDGKVIPTSDKYLISAKAGKVNYVEGATAVSRSGGTTGMLLKGDQLEVDEQVSTGALGKAEILLNPGSYVRLGENAEFSFKSTSLDDLRLKVARGSAIFEVFATNQFKVSIYTPKSRVTIINTGVYRLDVEPSGNALLSVIEGQAVVGEKIVAIVKEGQTGTVNGGAVVIGKFDKDRRDALATWSRDRSKDLAKVAKSLKNNNARTSLISAFQAGVWGQRRSFGVWVFDPISGLYCFLPYYSGWNSPYGYGYGWNIYGYQLPPNVAPINPPTRLDGRLDPPVDSEMDNRGSRSRPSQTYSSPNDGFRDAKPIFTAPSSPSPTSAREPVYSPPPPPPPVKTDKPGN